MNHFLIDSIVVLIVSKIAFVYLDGFKLYPNTKSSNRLVMIFLSV